MKLSDLFESPELRDVDKDQSSWIDMDEYGKPGRFISIDTMDRKYDVLTTIKLSIEPRALFVVALAKNKTMAGVFFRTQTTEGRDVMAVCCLVYFKQPILTHPPVDMQGVMLQVDRVATVSQYEGNDIASSLYAELVNAGYVVVYDTIQYRGGMKLWKKIARRSITGNYKVHIYDGQINDYLRDTDNQILTYTEKNIPDNAIWLTGKPGQQFILIAKA
jgi:hypothetical protein